MHEQSHHESLRRRGFLGTVATGVHSLLVLAALGVVLYAAIPLLHVKTTPATQPSTMEAVDWHSPDSSIYCLACHKQVAPAMAGLDVQQGHSHNVILNDAQLKVIKRMGTVAGPDGVLICMSCHKLGQDNPHMLADTLKDSKLCQDCHPGQFTLIGGKHDLRTSAPHEMNRVGQTAESGGPCSACHLSHHYAREFEPCELDPDGRCITCHKIGRAAARLARPTMEHPKSQCIICHNPHNDANEHFLKKPGAQMCADCHQHFAEGPAGGMHPLGAMPYDVPESLVQVGAQVFGKPRELTCLVCHSTHSSTHKPLLIMPANTNELCLACHDKELAAKAELPGGGHNGMVMPRHAQSPKLTVEQRKVVEGRGGIVGPDGELLCVSCHRVHHAQPGAELLTFRPNSDDGCTACHAKQATVAGTVHDLRTQFPDEKNVAGISPREGGSCSACHMSHGQARKPGPTGVDATGACTSCHQPGGLASSHLEGDPGHPSTNCIACHNPHEGGGHDFLAKTPDELCRQCHADMFSLVGGPHDRSKNPGKWKQTVAGKRADAGACLTCHMAHGKKGSGLFSLPTKADSYHDSMCLNCHEQTAWGANTAVAAIHPRKISPEQKRVPVALVPTDDQGNLRMGCRTCHNPHGGADPVHLARVKPGVPTADLCLHCHDDKRLIERTGHASAKLAKIGHDTDSCKPCHAMHANPADAWGQMLSPRFLMAAGLASQPAQQVGLAGAATLSASGGASASTRASNDIIMAPIHEAAVPCLVCHHAGGPAPVRDISTHPPVTMVNIVSPGSPGYMPLFNADGKVDPRGQITCRTCHLSHGQPDLLKAAADLPPDEQRSARMQLRPFTAENLCTQCHGTTGRLKFLFFHNLSQRKTQG